MNKIKLALHSCGLLGGIVSLITSFTISSMRLGGTESNSSYGRDAYTGIQNAAAQTARNMYYANELLAKLAFTLLFVLGLALIAYFGIKVYEEVSKSDTKIFISKPLGKKSEETSHE